MRVLIRGTGILMFALFLIAGSASANLVTEFVDSADTTAYAVDPWSLTVNVISDPLNNFDLLRFQILGDLTTGTMAPSGWSTTNTYTTTFEPPTVIPPTVPVGWNQSWLNGSLVGSQPANTILDIVGSNTDQVRVQLNFTGIWQDMSGAAYPTEVGVSGSPSHYLNMLVTAWSWDSYGSVYNFAGGNVFGFYWDPASSGSGNHLSYNPTDVHGPPPVPEPVSMVMLGCLGAGMLGARKLRSKKAAA
ncbi:MAG: hypothetical protein HZB26_19415 [Candidatus Hydrogenedentes bacterium]|nr:hypothetical protein [Candidatus Hydrogenedentota bacterium]